jgi:diguanylate cyclase (GGDEF)-like protein
VPSRIRLPYALLVGATIAFVTLLIALTDDLQGLWPLLGIPILTAAVAYNASGAVLVGAAVAAVLGLLSTDLGIASDPGLVEELVIGIGVFVGSGVLIGLRIGRDERRQEALERSTIRDELTDLYTRDHFLLRLDEDIKRSRRYELPLSVLLVELDGLDEFNATVGTHRGDLLVAHVAEILPMSIRETDVLARIERGLFGMILPFARKSEVISVGERIRHVIETTDFEGDEIEPVTHHTVSVGASEYLSPKDDGSTLLVAADEALTRAKETGGNRVLFATEPSDEGVPAENDVPDDGSLS